MFDLVVCVPCSMFPHANDSNQREYEIGVSVSCDDSKQEDEFRRKVEFEAEERKLEETLEYQRQMENEGKQKLLAEQHEKAGGILLDNLTEGSHTDSKPTAYPVELEQLRYNKHDSFLSDDHPSNWKQIDLGASYLVQASLITDNQNNELGQFRNDPGGHDVQLNPKVEGVSLSNHEKPYLDEDWDNGMKNSAGLHAKTERNINPIKSSTLARPSALGIKRANNNSHPKFNQGKSTIEALIGF